MKTDEDNRDITGGDIVNKNNIWRMCEDKRGSVAF